MNQVTIKTLGNKLKVTIDGKRLDNVKAFVAGSEGGDAVVTLTLAADVTISADKADVTKECDMCPNAETLPKSDVATGFGVTDDDLTSDDEVTA